MSELTRREFLRIVAAGMGAAGLNQLLAACRQGEAPTTPEEQPASNPPAPAAGAGPQANTQSPTSKPFSPPSATAERAPTHTPGNQPTSAATNAPAGLPDLVVVRHGEPEEMVRRALAALGGIERFVSPGARVIIKPNICVAYHTYEYAATTNPWVVAALVKQCLGAGAASVSVMDAPFGGTAEEAYTKSGIAEQVKAAGGQMANMPGFKYIATKIPNAASLRQAYIFDDILKADVLIDVPIAKHHSLARLTIGMKNLMGVIRDRSALHLNIGENLTDLASFLRPKLTVVDAVRILKRNGPTGGNLNDVQKLETIIASTDIVAADSYAATLFGLQPQELSYIAAATRRGLGRSDLGSLKIEEINAGA